MWFHPVTRGLLHTEYTALCTPLIGNRPKPYLGCRFKLSQGDDSHFHHMITDLRPVKAHDLVQLFYRITLDLWIRILQKRDETSYVQQKLADRAFR